MTWGTKLFEQHDFKRYRIVRAVHPHTKTVFFRLQKKYIFLCWSWWNTLEIYSSFNEARQEALILTSAYLHKHCGKVQDFIK